LVSGSCGRGGDRYRRYHAVGPDCDEQPVRTFRTLTDDLERLADWFARCGIKTIAMESTGVYWIPVFEILEQRGF
jgi:transposase